MGYVCASTFFYLKTSKLYYIFTSRIIYDPNALARDHVNNFWDTSTPICQTESLTGIYTTICSCMILITYCLVYICVCCIWVIARYNVGKIRVFLNFEHVLSPHVIK